MNNNIAGLKIRRNNNRQTGTQVSLYDGIPAQLDISAGRWITVCEDHGTMCAHSTVAMARSHLSYPLGWCDDCRNNEGKTVAGDCHACYKKLKVTDNYICDDERVYCNTDCYYDYKEQLEPSMYEACCYCGGETDSNIIMDEEAWFCSEECRTAYIASESFAE